MAFSEFAFGDLVKLINGASGESKAIWRINGFDLISGDNKLEKYNGPEALPRKMITEKSNVRGLTDEELDSLAMWSRGSFVRTTYKGDTYIGEVLRIIWDCKKGISARVIFVGILEGISRSGEPFPVPIRNNKHFWITLEEAKLMDCTEAEVEWLKDRLAQLPKTFVMPKPQYEHGWVTETVRITSAWEIAKAFAEEEEQNKAGPMYARVGVYGVHSDEKGERFYTKKVTRRLGSEEVEQLSQQQERIKNPRNEHVASQMTFDDFLHEDRLKSY